MATRVDLIFREGNDETIRMTIVPDDPAENMLLVSSLRTYVKSSACDSDTDVNTLVLTTANPTQMVIVSHTVGQLVAEAYVPAAYLVRAFDRTWRVDAHVGSTHRTAMYGNVSVVDL
jgi:hypothetical protein